jgi:mannose-6-phosphate isomerase-like protein (cupin superfamily)
MTAIRIVGPGDGETVREPDGSHNRFMVSAGESGGGFALVDQLLAPRRLVAPLHRHSREDEYNYVLEGRVGAVVGPRPLGAPVTAQRLRRALPPARPKRTLLGKLPRALEA